MREKNPFARRRSTRSHSSSERSGFDPRGLAAVEVFHHDCSWPGAWRLRACKFVSPHVILRSEPFDSLRSLRAGSASDEGAGTFRQMVPGSFVALRAPQDDMTT